MAPTRTAGSGAEQDAPLRLDRTAKEQALLYANDPVEVGSIFGLPFVPVALLAGGAYQGYKWAQKKACLRSNDEKCLKKLCLGPFQTQKCYMSKCLGVFDRNVKCMKENCVGNYEDEKCFRAQCIGRYKTDACMMEKCKVRVGNERYWNKLGKFEAIACDEWKAAKGGGGAAQGELEPAAAEAAEVPSGVPAQALDSDDDAYAYAIVDADGRAAEEAQASPEDGGTALTEGGALYGAKAAAKAADGGYTSYSAVRGPEEGGPLPAVERGPQGGYGEAEEAPAAEADSAEGCAFEAAADGGLAHADGEAVCLWHGAHEPPALC